MALAAVCWLSIVLGAILTRMPYVDEGYYTLSPYSRVARGDWGAHEIEPSAFIYASIDMPLTRIDRRAYWVMPLESCLQAAWYRIVGWGLVQQRLLSVAAAIAPDDFNIFDTREGYAGAIQLKRRETLARQSRNQS